MRPLFHLAVFFSALAALPAADFPWAGKLTTAPGSFPAIKPFEGEFRFGWSNIEAAQARAVFRRDGSKLKVDVEGGSLGWARTLWSLDATHQTLLSADGLRPFSFRQFEKYANRTVTTEAEFRPDALWRLRQVSTDPKKAKWKRIRVEPIYDMVSGMLFIRSQPLADGDKVRLIVFPGDSAFLTEVNVLKREPLRIAGKSIPAIKLDFSLQKIVRNDGGGSYRLEPFSKLKRGTVWISDDADRVPLRAEVSVFVGFVYGELKYARFADGHSLP